MSAPWTPERIAAEVARRYPGTCAWLGRHTGSWWACARDRTGRHRLVEAPTPAALVHRLDELGVRRADAVHEPRPPRVAVVPPPSRPRGRPAPPVRRRPARLRRGWLRAALDVLVTP
ncbi:hypothetical protein [Actinomadura sp. WMMB 499]|uniref:hypothetical protein n=1 Tax=Actinomadura sp. WMMB 499 TaxID=1219491 RepID=UPI00159DB314|nr:hypothetical protein [Actinomadura sp. WMMB 499]